MSYLMPEAVDVIIVGGGFSGITLAFNLTKCNPDLEIVIARSPKGPRFGVAYETDFEAHLLNVPAKGMSAFPDLPHDFVEWAHQQGLPLEPNSFAPRKLYRQYLEDLLKEITAGGKVRLVEKEVTNVTKSPKGWQVEFSDGTLMSASQITLAFGGFPPAHVPETRSVTRHPAFVENPWTEIDRCRLAYAEKVAIIGAGLTAIDVILSCENLGFEGTYTLHSRRGLMAQVHDLSIQPLPAESIPQPNASIRQLLKSVRKAAEQSLSFGSNWRAVIDGMRPRMSTYWQTLSPESKRRFLSHVRPFWEVHRHRLAPEIHSKLQALIKDSRLTVQAGKLLSISSDRDRLVIRQQPNADGPSVVQSVDLLFNCTGPTSNVRSWPSPLIQNLLAAGTIETDSYDRGINCDSDGKVQEGLYVLGHPRRGMLWESTAVPELRVQSSNLSRVIAQSMPERVR